MGVQNVNENLGSSSPTWLWNPERIPQRLMTPTIVEPSLLLELVAIESGQVNEYHDWEST